MTTVVGVDLSLTATGVAVIRDGLVHEVRTVASKGKRGDSLAVRDGRLTRIASEIGNLCEDVRADLVLLEGPSFGSHGGSQWDRAGLWWETVMCLRRAVGVPVGQAAPTVVKKFASGRGNGDKAAVAVGIARLWPEVECANDNEFDALTLSTMAAQKLGMTVPIRAHHAECLVKVEWPDLGEAAVAA